MLKACVDISRVREDLADIVDFAIEELIRQKYELPAFSALLRAARTARATVNRGYYTRIAKALDPAVKQRIDRLFERLPEVEPTASTSQPVSVRTAFRRVRDSESGSNNSLWEN
jgi:hypothetical protein